MEAKEPAQAEVQAEADDFDAVMRAFDESAGAVAKESPSEQKQEEVKEEAKEEEKQPAEEKGARTQLTVTGYKDENNSTRFALGIDDVAECPAIDLVSLVDISGSIAPQSRVRHHSCPRRGDPGRTYHRHPRPFRPRGHQTTPLK